MKHCSATIPATIQEFVQRSNCILLQQKMTACWQRLLPIFDALCQLLFLYHVDAIIVQESNEIVQATPLCKKAAVHVSNVIQNISQPGSLNA
jgi:hypothetical protein